MDINKIISKCLKGDKASEKKLYVHYAPLIYSIARRYTSFDALAKDYLQESFINVFQKLNKYDHNKGSFDSWLYTVCTNTILQQIRKEKKNRNILYLENLPETEITEEEFQIIDPEELINAIRKLPEGYRMVLNLFVFEEWSHKEISQFLHITESASRSQLTRAKRLLKKILTHKISKYHEKRLAR